MEFVLGDGVVEKSGAQVSARRTMGKEIEQFVGQRLTSAPPESDRQHPQAGRGGGPGVFELRDSLP